MDFGKPLFGSVNKPKRCAKLLLCSESESHPCLDGSDNRILVIGQHTRGSLRTILCVCAINILKGIQCCHNT